ncbi:hypothetical protein [Neptunomonas sp.]|uniref:hypothetical protein n=1 Tax=Neptunomonas TaxID=75687 RepID=UPI0035159F6D
MTEAKKVAFIVKDGSRVRHGGKLFKAGEELALTQSEVASVKAHVSPKASSKAAAETKPKAEGETK